MADYAAPSVRALYLPAIFYRLTARTSLTYRRAHPHLEYQKAGKRNGTVHHSTHFTYPSHIRLTFETDQYKEWFYVNLHTKQSQWEKPTEPAYATPEGGPAGPPPGYAGHGSQAYHTGPEKGGYGSNNPYGGSSTTDDEKLARQLQAEEEARAHGRPTSRGASDGYYQGSGAAGAGAASYAAGGAGAYGGGGQSSYGGQPSYGGQAELPPRGADGKKGGFLGKLLGKTSGGSSSAQGYGGYPQQQQQHYGGGYPQQHGYPQQGYGGYPPQQQYYGQAPVQKKHGLGMGGGAALGLGGGLLGGMMLGEAMGDMGDGGGDGGGGDDGGDYGGGDDGGGDMGGGDF